MSAITETDPTAIVPGVHQYKTKIKVVVHSHLSDDPIFLSDDVYSCKVAKNIKGVGRANIAIVPSVNYLNLLFPNDIINIYFHRNDGQGWVRTFFGYLDRIEEEYSVSENGQPSSMYHIVASDWQKALQKTEVYFNPHLSGRRDINGSDFATINLGGIGLITRGLIATGTPPDVIITMLLLQLGYGSQWILPSSYRPNVPERFIELRKQYSSNRLLQTMENKLRPEAYNRLRELVNSGELERLREESVENANATEDPTEVPPSVADAARAQGIEPDELPSRIGNLDSALDREGLARLQFSAEVSEALGENPTRGSDPLSLRSPDLNAYFNSMSSDIRVGNASLLDIVNLFDFVERKAIDGWTFDHNIYSKQGPLLNILRGASNEVVNELIFDLRPMSATGSISEGTDWDRSPDEIGGNEPGDGVQEAGVRYMPSIVMREYPFSTVYEVDASNIAIRQRDQINGRETERNFGILYFGAIYSNRPNEPGRHIVQIPVINVEDLHEGVPPDTVAEKHLDVAVVRETEIEQTRFGRSDQDMFNLFEMWTDNALGSSHKFFLKDFIPIITPISIARHGLRKRSVRSRFARFDLQTSPNVEQRPEPEEEEEEEPEEASSDLDTEVVPPVAEPPSSSYQVLFRNAGNVRYGYRPSTRGGQYWHFHNGIDISGRNNPVQGHGSVPIGSLDDIFDVVSIADGYIVASIQTGTRGFSGYGNYIAIEHPQFETSEGKVYSIYAHLTSRAPIAGNTENSRTKQDAIAQGHHWSTNDSSNFEKIFVRKGQTIGKMGRTFGTASDPSRMFQHTPIPHLHFEINSTFISKSPSTPDIAFNESAKEDRAEQMGEAKASRFLADHTVPASGPRPTATSTRSTDPVEFFSSKGINLEQAISSLNTEPEGEQDEEVEPDEGGGEDVPTDEEEQTSREAENVEDETQTAQQSSARNNVSLTGINSEGSARKQLGRWALLQDHWYQHNLEYLSGQVIMRGAPEVRVGYRLDLPDRKMSFYVESVQHSWQYTNNMKTTLQVTRGQPNDPYPAYALPPTPGFNTTEVARRTTSRLARYALVPDPIAVRRAIVLRGDTSEYQNRTDGSATENLLDDPQNWGTGDYNFGELPQGLLPAEIHSLDIRSMQVNRANREDPINGPLEGLEDGTYGVGDIVDADEDDPLIAETPEPEESNSLSGSDGAEISEQSFNDLIGDLASD